MTDDFRQRCGPIELILCDVDGVLTDGGIIFDSAGVESKRFHVRDGLGIKLWQKAGKRFGIITSRRSAVVEARMAELGVEIVCQGVRDKLAAARSIAAACGLGPEQVGYLGDDLPDLAAARWAGLAIAVADACAELRLAAHWVTGLPGGSGAVREAIERILKAQRGWDELVRAVD